MNGRAGKWRFWGSNDFIHWRDLNAGRPKKELTLEVDTAGRSFSAITPGDPEAVKRILIDHRNR